MLDRALVRPRRIEVETVSAGCLRARVSATRRAKQVINGLRVVGEEADADADARIEFATVDLKARDEGIDQRLRHPRRVVGAFDVDERHDELVVAVARDDVAFPHDVSDTLGGAWQQRAAESVTEPLADRLETIQIEN